MHCSIAASRLLGWPAFLAASAVSGCNARAPTESAVTSSIERVLVHIFLSCRCDCFDHERVTPLARHLVIRSAVVGGGRPMGAPEFANRGLMLALVAAAGRLHVLHLLHDLLEVVDGRVL